MKRSFERICVVGLGYIGLPTASLLATKGFQVHGVDVSREVVDTINAGRIHIREPELDVLVRSAVQSGRLKASLAPEKADVFILAVPTPFKEGYVPDLGYVEAATDAIGEYLEPGNLVILESTCPVGTTDMVTERIRRDRPDLAPSDVRIAHCPERVLPGRILRELVDNDRIVGGVDPESTEAASRFYQEFVAGEVLTTDARTAELTKLTENTFRDVNIAFANELSMVCERLGVDAWELIRLANHHPRVDILQPGPGVGGHCIAVDPWFIVDSAPAESRLIRMSREVNNSKPAFVADKVLREADSSSARVVACLGLAFKANVDDLRESPAVEVCQRVCGEFEGDILIAEPYIERLPPSFQTFPKARLEILETCISDADVIVILVDHDEFKQVDWNRWRHKPIIDTRGLVR